MPALWRWIQRNTGRVPQMPVFLEDRFANSATYWARQGSVEEWRWQSVRKVGSCGVYRRTQAPSKREWPYLFKATSKTMRLDRGHHSLQTGVFCLSFTLLIHAVFQNSCIHYNFFFFYFQNFGTCFRLKSEENGDQSWSSPEETKPV